MPESPPVTTRAGSVAARILVQGGKLVMNERAVTIYHHDPKGGPPTAGRPNEVAWLVVGLPRDQSIRFDAKPHSRGKGYMEKDDYGPLKLGSNPLYSERTRKGPARGAQEKWTYSVTLENDQGTVIDTIDPDVIIELDP